MIILSLRIIGWMDVGMKCSKLFVCICKHTATRIRIRRGGPSEVGYLMVSASWPSALHKFALQPVSYSLQSRQRPHPKSSNLDGYALRQN